MEYCPAGDLRSYLAGLATHRLPEDEAQNIAIQLLIGLDLMHEERFTHRDFKPGVSPKPTSDKLSY
jgi:serine/threonine protein kinase